ncbi:MAG: hypothetical protein GXZ19_08875 [Bacteroidales bacterium]|nr:hypothetical protein [Bacteroidales bacterium]
MKRARNTIICSAAALLLFLPSCSDENLLFDTPFISVEALRSDHEGTINSDQQFIGEYMVYINGYTFTEEIVVEYTITVGNGLVAGRDYEIITKGENLTFYPNIFDMPIRIRWLRTAIHENPEDLSSPIISDSLDESKDNTITIELTGSNTNYLLGYPGPDRNKKSVVIKKIRAID